MGVPRMFIFTSSWPKTKFVNVSMPLEGANAYSIISAWEPKIMLSAVPGMVVLALFRTRAGGVGSEIDRGVLSRSCGVSQGLGGRQKSRQTGGAVQVLAERRVEVFQSEVLA